MTSVIAFVQASKGDEHLSLETPVSATALDAVLFDFNPSADARVTKIKALCAALITVLEPIRDLRGPGGRTAATAITQLEIAQMVAVKALFAKV